MADNAKQNPDAPAAGGAKKGNRWRAPLIGILIIFILGLGLGYYIWEYRGNGPRDYKQVLTEVIDYIATLEHKNRGLTQRMTELGAELATVKAELAKTPQEKAVELKSLDERILELEGERSELQDEVRQLRQRLKMLQAELEASRVQDVRDSAVLRTTTE